MRFMGVTRPDPELSREITRLTPVLREKARPRYILERFRVELTGDGCAIGGTTLVLPGRHIRAVLEHSSECWLLAATLGQEADRLIDNTRRMSVSDALTLDAIADAYIETVCDSLQDSAAKESQLTRRFSPGYGDLPLSVQPMLLEVLDTLRRIGLTCTERCLMLPRKSVTAIMGITERHSEAPGCAGCLISGECTWRKAGDFCGR